MSKTFNAPPIDVDVANLHGLKQTVKRKLYVLVRLVAVHGY